MGDPSYWGHPKNRKVLIDWKAVHLFRTPPHGVFFHKQEVFLRPQKVAALGFSRTWELQTA